MSDHDHGHGSGKTLLFSLVFTTAFAVVEVVGGILADSLALLSDAGHMLTDSLSLGVGAFAAWLATKPASHKHSFGLQRAEVLGALFNVLFMFGVIAFIGYEAIRRMADPPPVAGGVVLFIGGLGLLVNMIVAWVLMRGERTMNVRGALLHVMGDLLGSVAALAAGAIIYLGGPLIADPLLSLFVSLLILISAGRLLREVLRVLMEGVPRDVDAREVGRALAEVEGVRMVHDMHIWSLSSRRYAMAAHVDLDRMTCWERVLPRLQAILRERFGIVHSTLQPEDTAIRRACDAQAGCGIDESAPAGQSETSKGSD
ncbi:cation diffusion facilitator family transporter [Salinisphaera sp. PC39]|uniref:cation diffusion facilitator family transporter n=1 Tax=Salinisphaera sp. PC39 TaxID=1304156 RepID=UPI0033428C9A